MGDQPLCTHLLVMDDQQACTNPVVTGDQQGCVHTRWSWATSGLVIGDQLDHLAGHRRPPRLRVCNSLVTRAARLPPEDSTSIRPRSNSDCVAL
jgi:hypothetical protein